MPWHIQPIQGALLKQTKLTISAAYDIHTAY